MNVDPANPAQPAPGANPIKRRRVFAPPAKPSRTMVLIFIGAALFAVAFIGGLYYIYRPVPKPPSLAPEFRDFVNYFAIQPPRGWTVDDRALPSTVVVQGPRDLQFRPLMLVTYYPAPGKLAQFVAEHKARIKVEEPSTQFTAEDTESIDGREAVRIEYDCDYSENAQSEKFKLKTMQFIIRDPEYYVYYKITCSARADSFADYRAIFEASARTFHLLPMPKVQPRFLNK